MNFLHCDVEVTAIAAGHSVLGENPSRNDRLRNLSQLGTWQAQKLQEVMRGSEFNVIITPQVQRFRMTAGHVLQSDCGHPCKWYFGKSNSTFYCPSTPEGVESLAQIYEAVTTAYEKDNITHPRSYAVWRSFDYDSVFLQFRAEMLNAMRAIPAIDQARRIVFFGDAIINNAFLHALFPQHEEWLLETAFAPCDRAVVTREKCTHYPFADLLV